MCTDPVLKQSSNVWILEIEESAKRTAIVLTQGAQIASPRILHLHHPVTIDEHRQEKRAQRTKEELKPYL